MRDGLHHRRSIRLDDYDYTHAGAYFVTLVTAGRVERFGAIVNGEMHLNMVGKTVLREWQRLPGRFPGWEIDAFVIMPNHMHGVLIHVPDDSITPRMGAAHAVGAQRCIGRHRPGTASLRPYDADTYPSTDVRPDGDPRPNVIPGSLGAVVRAFKSSTTLRYHATRGTSPGPLWQRNYYEHIVRGPADLERICAYILSNPIQWELDRENPDRTST